jgi:hypothetical protein
MDAAGKQVGVVEPGLTLVVLRLQSKHAGLDAQIDVAGDQRDLDVGVGAGQGLRRGEDIRVGGRLGDEIKSPESLAEGQAALHLGGADTAQQLIKEAGGLKRVPRFLALAMACVIQAVEDSQRQIEVLFAKAENGRWVVQED